VAAVLSPALAFLMAIAVEILIGSLTDVGVPALNVLIAARTIGWPHITWDRLAS
jgi:hypothetical protein